MRNCVARASEWCRMGQKKTKFLLFPTVGSSLCRRCRGNFHSYGGAGRVCPRLNAAFHDALPNRPWMFPLSPKFSAVVLVLKMSGIVPRNSKPTAPVSAIRQLFPSSQEIAPRYLVVGADDPSPRVVLE